ncbi:porin family protein [Kaistella sp.]|uniref:porin family protein n=1 Tax=Kaistella sp. TaxID=2782235 RepID=UPI002F9413DC
MIRKILLLSAGIIFSGLYSQQIRVGVKAGYTYSNLNSNDKTANEKFEPKSGYYAGLSAEKRWGEKFATQVEAIYANLGSQTTYENAGATVKQYNHLHRLVVPVSLKYYVTYELGVFAGGYLSSKISNNVKFKTSGDIAVTDEELNEMEKEYKKYLDDNLKSTELGVQFGIDYRAFKSVYIEARYSLGLSNMIKNPTNDEKMTMSFLQAGIAYKF